MRSLNLVVIPILCLSAQAALAGEFKDHCANGLANYQLLVETDCSVNWLDEKSGKTYCFSSANSKAEFLEDVEANLKKATEHFADLDDE